MGNLWAVATFLGPVLLAAVILWAIARNRKQRPEEIVRTERATHEEYMREDREDHERERRKH